MVCSIKHFYHYLCDRYFKVRSDHGSLRWYINFKICEGALARILETLAIYDFDVEFCQGSRHSNANSISRRPCLDQECAHCEWFEKRYTSSKIFPGFANRNTGVMSVEGVKRGGESVDG